jgi:hypothetical protein
MIVTGIFRVAEEELMVWPDHRESQCTPDRAQPFGHTVYEEKIAENETLVAVRARNLRQATLLSDLLAQAGAWGVEIDAEAA